MENLKRINPEDIKGPQKDTVTKMAGEVSAVIGSYATPEQLTVWSQHAYDEQESAIFQRLGTALATVQQAEDKIGYQDFIELLGAAHGAVLSVDGVADDVHQYLATHLSDVDQVIRANNGDGIDTVVSFLSFTNNPKTDNYVLDHLGAAVVKSPERDSFEWLFDELLENQRNDLIPRVVRGFSRVLVDWAQLDPEVDRKVLEWCDLPCEQNPDFPSIVLEHRRDIKEHVRRAVALEQAAYGSTEYLMDEYNIHCFARYPQHVLLDQYTNRDQRSGKPYGLLVGAQHDWNHAFRYSEEAKIWDRFYQQVTNAGYEFRVLEVGTVDDLIYLTYQEKKKYGQADFAIGHSHGNIFTFVLGEEERDAIRYRDLSKKSSVVVTDTLKPNGHLIFSGCNIGRIGGMAQKISERGFTVMASNNKSNITNINFFPGENPPIDVTFRHPQNLQVYKDGNILVDKGERVY